MFRIRYNRIFHKNTDTTAHPPINKGLKRDITCVTTDTTLTRFLGVG